MSRWIAVLIMLAGLSSQALAGLDVRGVRLWAAPDNTRLVLDTSGPVRHTVSRLHRPERLIIDIPAARLLPSVKQKLPRGGVIREVRTAQRNRSDLRIVLDLARTVKAKSFVLKPNQQYGHRLVVDLLSKPAQAKASRPVKSDLATPRRELVIAIDAGHGGEDPGAKGRRGTREKDVVMKIARKLVTLVNREPGMRAVLTRKGDYFLSLRKRMQKAREAHADMFVSIHADAFHDRSARGASVFILSSRGASSEMARWLAKQENASDLVGGVSLDDKDDLLKEVLLDLAQAATRQSSAEAAGYVLKEMQRIGKTHKRRVQKAGFVVLKSPDIPSMLIETAFISNPGEEKRLRSPEHQQKIAEAIMRGVRRYFAGRRLPQGLRMAGNQPVRHKIRRGDTLSQIALRYGVSQKAIRRANGLRKDRLLVGKVLRIPVGQTARVLPAKHLVKKAQPRKYRVRNGDTLSHIAVRYGVSQKSIRIANKIRGDRLLVGKVLTIPGRDS